jgi:predicted  nucleic acid-binding Zn-ribbon protein
MNRKQAEARIEKLDKDYTYALKRMAALQDRLDSLTEWMDEARRFSPEAAKARRTYDQVKDQFDQFEKDAQVAWLAMENLKADIVEGFIA